MPDLLLAGPDFAGHYAVIQIGCGTGCSFVYLGDGATGQVYDFPYGGEDYGRMQLKYSAKSPSLTVYWIKDGRVGKREIPSAS